MAANAARCSALDTFRSVWARGHLDYQRAVEALEAATRSAEQVRLVAFASIADREVRRAEQDLECARRRVAEIEAVLEEQFDRFCGVPT
jgi:hypothetical protein